MLLLLDMSRCSPVTNLGVQRRRSPAASRWGFDAANTCRLHLTSTSASLMFSGGGERDRTDDPLLAKQVLSQLSYTPGECNNY